MSPRLHFWLRIVGLAVILMLEFGRRVHIGPGAASPGRIAAAAVTSR